MVHKALLSIKLSLTCLFVGEQVVFHNFRLVSSIVVEVAVVHDMSVALRTESER
jgi:hypothetical protein